MFLTLKNYVIEAIRSMRIFLPCLFLVLLWDGGYGQLSAVDSTSILQRDLARSKPNDQRVSFLINLGDRYLQGRVKNKKRIDSAVILYQEAYSLSIKLKNELLANRSLISIAVYNVENGKVENGRMLFKRAIEYYRRTEKKIKEAETLNMLSLELWSLNPEKYKQERQSYIHRAAKLYSEAGDKAGLHHLQAWNIRELLRDRKLDAAEKACMSFRAECLSKKHYGESYTWVLNTLYEIAVQQSDPYKQLFFELENVDQLTKHPENATVFALEACYFHLSSIYFALGNYKKSEYYASKQLPLTRQINGSCTFGLHYWIYSLLKQRRTEQALSVLKKTVNEFQPSDIEDKNGVLQLYGSIYSAQKKYYLAEKAFKESIELYEIMDPKHSRLDQYWSAYKSIINFYIWSKQYKKAVPFIPGLQRVAFKLPPSYRKNFAFSKSIIDSADRNYLSALQNFQNFKRLSDSLFDADRSAKLNQLEVSYGAKEKQSQINLLDAQNRAHISEARRANTMRNITVIGIIFLTVITVFMLYTVRKNIRTNRLLKIRNHQIDIKNDSLQKLVVDKEELIMDKERLLGEKDMLLKEVHHRVKNNLQIVMSLLSTQLTFLESKDAVEAIEESQQRVHSIALIHQKLYREDGGASIDMKSYVQDMVEDLSISFNAEGRGIRFITKVDAINLDIDQAVPVGLILNEAITNAIKYAFDDTGGHITIDIKALDNDRISLRVIDTGKGLPEWFNLSRASSLGMEMMKGLSKQLKGTFEINSRNGVSVELEFPAQVRIESNNLQELNT